MPRRLDHIHVVERPLSPADQTLIEYTKDVWYAGNLAGVRQVDTASNWWIHFEQIPERFRSFVKEWCKFLLARFSFTHCVDRVHYLEAFLGWLVESTPSIMTFADLTTSHIDAYLSYLQRTPNAQGKQRSDDQMSRLLHGARAVPQCA